MPFISILTPTGVIVCDISEAATLPLGFRYQDRVMTPRGLTIVLGVDVASGLLYFQLEKGGKTTYWPVCKTKTDFDSLGFVAMAADPRRVGLARSVTRQTTSGDEDFILVKGRTGVIECDISEAATLPLGFRYQDRVITPRGPAIVMGVDVASGLLYFQLENEREASFWSSCRTKEDFEKRGFVILQDDDDLETVEPVIHHLATFTVSTTPIRRGHTSASVDGTALDDISTRMVTTLPPPNTNIESTQVSIWPTYSSGAVLVATSGGNGGTTQEVLSIRPTVVRGDPMFYEDVGCVTAEDMSASLKAATSASTAMLCDSLAAEVHLSMIRLFARRLGVSNVEPAQLHQRVVVAMRSSTPVTVDSLDGSSWSLQWDFTSVSCSLVARVPQEKPPVVINHSPVHENPPPPAAVSGIVPRHGCGDFTHNHAELGPGGCKQFTHHNLDRAERQSRGRISHGRSSRGNAVDDHQIFIRNIQAVQGILNERGLH